MRCEIAVDIDSGPNHVWAVLTDVTRWPRWTGAVRDTALVGGGALALDRVVRLRTPHLPERMWRVREFHARRHRLALVGEGFGGQARVRFALTDPDGDAARTHVAIAHDRAGWFGSPMARLTARTLDTHLQTLAHDLKAHCETRRRSSVTARAGDDTPVRG